MSEKQPIKDVAAKKIEFILDNRMEVTKEQLEAATVSCRLVLEKLLSEDQMLDPVKIIFGSRIVDGDTELDRPAEAFPDGKTIVFAMKSPNMKTWEAIMGPVGAMLFLTAHEATHVAQIRLGNPPPNSTELIKIKGISAYQSDTHEKKANLEALDMFKALRPYARGTLIIGGVEYEFPEQTSYTIDRSEFPGFIIQ